MATQAHPLIDFAGQAVNVIRDLVSAVLSKKKPSLSKKFLGNLEAILESAASRLETLRDAHDAAWLDRVGMLLATLEDMTKFPSSFLATTDLTNLDQYVKLRRIMKGHSRRKWLKKLCKKGDIRGGEGELRELDQREQKQREFVKRLKDFLRATTGTRQRFIHSKLGYNAANIKRPDCRVYTRNLYGIVSRLCVCSLGEEDEEITANLELRKCCSLHEPLDAMDFRLFLLDHPHHNNLKRPSRWKDVQIRVPRKNPRKKHVKIMGVGETPMPAKELRDGEKFISTGTFCKVITDELHSQLQLAVSRDGNVIPQLDQPCLEGFILDRPSVSLAELLKLFNSQNLAISQRVLLSYVLAKSFWQLYGTDWMCFPWDKEHVHFMVKSWSNRTPEGRLKSETVVYLSEPFLSTRFKSGDDEPQPGIHRFPKVLALGILFLEIGLGRGIQEWPCPEHIDKGSHSAENVAFYTAWEAFQEAIDLNGTVTIMGDVIEQCISATYFWSTCERDVEKLLEAIQKDVVNVLSDKYKALDKDKDADATSAVTISLSTFKTRVTAVEKAYCTTSLPFSKGMSSQPQRESYSMPPWENYDLALRRGLHSELGTRLQYSPQILQPFLGYPSYQLPPHNQFEDGTMSRQIITSRDWFQRFEILGRVLRQKSASRACSAVRITILDTGVLDDYKEFVGRYEDFTLNSCTEYQDLTGHGTEAVLLIRNVYPTADIYVGRVFERAQANEHTSSLMAKAINHAINEWKTDIIVISSGFENSSTKLDNAIKGASDAGTLIFAAASNYGNMTDIAFPARLYYRWKLFCMFATTASIRATCGFNPTPHSSAKHNFAILGEEVEIPYTKNFRSGTSYSTMIGAGLAGLILEFARHETAEGRVHGLKKLSTVEGMSAVFAAMAKDKDNGYDCIAPWKILSKDVRDECADKVAARKDVLDKIVAALRDCY